MRPLALVILALGCGYRPGRAPSLAASAGEVTVHAADPTLLAELPRALDEALARAGAAPGGPALSIEVVSVQGLPRAGGGAVQSLRVEVVATHHTQPPRSARWWIAEDLLLVADDPLATEAAKAAAARGLCDRIADEAVQRLLRAPAAEP